MIKCLNRLIIIDFALNVVDVILNLLSRFPHEQKSVKIAVS